MLDIQQDTKIALTLLEKGYIPTTASLKKYTSMTFLRTNEDLGAYFKLFPIKNGIVSTIIGSGDHVLQAIKDNPKEIHAFDLNVFAIYMAKLKIAACLALTLKQYEEYFEYCGEKSFNIEYYKKLREYLDEESKIFWDKLNIEGNLAKNYKRFFVTTMGNTNIGVNSFEKEKNYDKTKINIEKVKIEYYQHEFYKMWENIDDRIEFDAIFLSNIYNWLKSYDDEQYFLNYTRKELTKRLSDKGMIAVYCPPKYFARNKVTLTDEIDSNIKNSIVVYRKKI